MAEIQKLIIADAHAHIFPGKIAEKAVGAIGAFYSIPMQHPGSPEALLESGRAIGVRKYLVCSTATRPGQVVSINDFIRESCAVHPEFVGFGTLHPSFPDIPGEIRRIREMGLRGVKLHPDFQQFSIDDPAAFPIYEGCAEGGLPILFHTGDGTELMENTFDLYLAYCCARQRRKHNSSQRIAKCRTITSLKRLNYKFPIFFVI